MRRLFIGLVCLTILMPLMLQPPPANAAACTQTGVRREFRTLTTPQWDAYIAAVRVLLSGPAPTAYDGLVQKHYQYRSPTHGTPMYLPFHRAFLREFEAALQQVDPTVAVPYWDWSLDAAAPLNSPIWGSKYMGSPNVHGGAATVGPLGKVRVRYPTPHDVKRSWVSGSTYHSSTSLRSIILTSTSFNTFRSRISSAPVSAVHMSIGGDMLTMHAPNDPVYWMHIAFVDRLWADWQRYWPSQANSVGPLTLDTKITHYNTPIRDVIDTRNLCYVYDNAAAS